MPNQLHQNKNKLKPKQKRAIFIGITFSLMAFSLFLILNALEDSIVFYYTPKQVIEKKVPLDAHIRLGGVVVKGSVEKTETHIAFSLTDFEDEIHVIFEGILPDLFREGQGIVAEGRRTGAKTFEALTVLAKHDENYRPPNLQEKTPLLSLTQKGDG